MKKERSFVLALGVALGVVALQLLLLPLFAGPASTIGPRDLPVVVAGPAPATAQFAGRLSAARPGAFEVTEVTSAEEADALVTGRAAYAAFIIDQSGLSLHTASAASPTVALLLTQAAQQMGQGKPVPVTDLAPLPADDPRGGGFAAGFFPLILVAMAAAVGLYFAVPRFGARLTGLILFALLAGAAGATMLQSWMGVLGGEWLPVAGAISLFVLAVSGAVLGLASLLGPGGIGLGALLVLLIGNALAGVAAAPELLVQPWGQVGQWLPVGAGATLLRSASWFDGAGNAGPIWTLSAWAAGGILLMRLGALRQRRSTPAAPQ